MGRFLKDPDQPVQSSAFGADRDFSSDGRRLPPKPKPKTDAVRFRAELDLAELDDRGRPGATWSGRACELSRSQVAFLSRRMCYCTRTILLAVHLVDDAPVPLFGEVASCDYEGQGLYRTDLRLQEIPDNEEVRTWIRERHSKGSL